MALSPRLDLRQSQSLVMTPQLQQAIKLLQMTSQELATYVDQELERNPLLEQTELGQPAVPGEDGPTVADPGETAPALLDDPSGGGDPPPGADYNGSDAEYGPADGGLLGFDGAARVGSGGRPDFEEDEGFLDAAAEAPGLRDHLTAQLALEIADARQRLIGQALIDLLDDTGYLTVDPEEVAVLLGCETAEVDAVLATLRRFDPAGVFARSLKDCLALQLAEKDRLDPAMAALLDHLDLLARRDSAALQRLCGVDAEDLAEMVAEIRALDPKPGLRFGAGAAPAVIPDLLMLPLPGGGWALELNPETLPRVLINQGFHARIMAATRDRAARQFVSDQLQSANWLVKALQQRAGTILKVGAEIVAQQDGFFRHGIRALKPMILRDIAEAISMHESTVSRVVNGKYLSSPRGVFELKYFFSQAIGGADGGEAHSAEAVRSRIRALIEAEDPSKVLSDDTLVEVLRKEGIDIARRTVAKYREGMNIPSSVQRRREKMLRAGR